MDRSRRAPLGECLHADRYAATIRASRSGHGLSGRLTHTVETTPTLPVYMPATPGYREATEVFDTFAPVQPDEAVIAD